MIARSLRSRPAGHHLLSRSSSTTITSSPPDSCERTRGWRSKTSPSPGWQNAAGEVSRRRLHRNPLSADPRQGRDPRPNCGTDRTVGSDDTDVLSVRSAGRQETPERARMAVRRMPHCARPRLQRRGQHHRRRRACGDAKRRWREHKTTACRRRPSEAGTHRTDAGMTPAPRRNPPPSGGGGSQRHSMVVME